MICENFLCLPRRLSTYSLANYLMSVLEAGAILSRESLPVIRRWDVKNHCALKFSDFFFISANFKLIHWLTNTSLAVLDAQFRETRMYTVSEGAKRCAVSYRTKRMRVM